MTVNPGWLVSGSFLCGILLVAGCNNAATTDQPSASNSGDQSGDLPTAAIERRAGEDDDDEAEDVVVAEPESGTPEWYVREILRIRLMPFSTTTEEGEQQASTATESTEAEFDKQAAQRRERNLKVIEMARQAIALTHKDPEKEVVFNAAVHHMLDARLQLALVGEQGDVDALYEIADALQQSKPFTEVAAAAALTIVNFSHANAVRYAQTEPRWIQEFARQAQLFANRVSESQAAFAESQSETPAAKAREMQLKQDISRASQILMAAGQSCDAAGFAEDSKTCYQMIKAKYPDSPQAAQVAGILRRLNLKGQPLQLAGPTLDGNFLSIEEFKGKTVLVVFWSSDARPFVDQLPALTELLKKAQKHVTVVGVNLDTDESRLDAFLEQTGLAWPQIFYSEPAKRGWASPVASYYGITQLPTVWIVDPTGVVAESDVSSAELEPKLREVVRQSLKVTRPATSGTVVPAGNQN